MEFKKVCVVCVRLAIETECNDNGVRVDQQHHGGQCFLPCAECGRPCSRSTSRLPARFLPCSRSTDRGNCIGVLKWVHTGNSPLAVWKKHEPTPLQCGLFIHVANQRALCRVILTQNHVCTGVPPCVLLKRFTYNEMDDIAFRVCSTVLSRCNCSFSTSVMFCL